MRIFTKRNAFFAAIGGVLFFWRKRKRHGDQSAA